MEKDWEGLVKEQRARGTREGRSPKGGPPLGVTPGPPATGSFIRMVVGG